MPFSTDRRRIIAFMGLVFAGLPRIRPVQAASCSEMNQSFRQGDWTLDISFGKGSALYRSEASVTTMGLGGKLQILFGSDKKLSAQFDVSHYPVSEGNAEGPTAWTTFGNWKDRTFRLFAGDQEIGRLAAENEESNTDKFLVFRFGGRDEEPLEKLLDPLRRGVPIKASVVVDAREFVFFDWTPTGTEQVLDELQRRTLQQLDVIAAAGPKFKREDCCFLTTACCDAVGLPDDCFELMALRRYRDQVLRRMPHGPREIALYYALAPAILSSIRRTGSERELLRLYFSHILPCAVLAWLGARSLPRVLYTDMVTRLSRRHAPAIAGIIAPNV